MIRANAKGIAYFLVITSAVFWGSLGFFVKELQTFGLAASQVAAIRAIGGAAILAMYVLFKDRNLLRVSPGDLKYFAGTGILSFAFFSWCYFKAISEISISVAVILLYTSPVWVTVFSLLLFKEALTKQKIVAIILTMMGCGLVTGILEGGDYVMTPVGILAGLGSGLGYALYSIFGRYALKKYDPMTVTLYTFVFASLAFIPTSDLAGVIGLLAESRVLLLVVGICIFGTVLPFLLYTKGLSQLDTSKAAIIVALEPIVATMIGVGLYAEPLTAIKLLGISLVVVAVGMMR